MWEGRGGLWGTEAIVSGEVFVPGSEQNDGSEIPLALSRRSIATRTRRAILGHYRSKICPRPQLGPPIQKVKFAISESEWAATLASYCSIACFQPVKCFLHSIIRPNAIKPPAHTAMGKPFEEREKPESVWPSHAALPSCLGENWGSTGIWRYGAVLSGTSHLVEI